MALPHNNRSHWDKVTRALEATNSPATCDDLRRAITTYNVRAHQCNFRPLELALADTRFGTHFFPQVLPGIITMALALPSLFPTALPLLKCSKSHRTETRCLTRRQLASLLANMFLCTFERHASERISGVEGAQLSGIDCLALFGYVEHVHEVMCGNAEKLKCLLHYFHKTQQRWGEAKESKEADPGEGEGPDRLERRAEWGSYLEQRVEFARRVSQTCMLDWRRSDVKIAGIQLEVSDDGKIEDVSHLKFFLSLFELYDF